MCDGVIMNEYVCSCACGVCVCVVVCSCVCVYVCVYVCVCVLCGGMIDEVIVCFRKVFTYELTRCP